MEEECRICGVFAFLIGPDETYARIEQGKWISESEYGTIHRVAGNGMTHGLLQRIVTYCEKKIPHLRTDTHQDNQIMQRCDPEMRFLQMRSQAQFIYCDIYNR